MLVRMAPSHLALCTLLLLPVAGSVSAQSSCLGAGSDLVGISCLTYLYVYSASTPSATCCSAVVSVTTDYGRGCLCEVIQFLQPNLDIPGRLYNLNGDCSANADMTNCSSSSTPSAGGVTTPPASVTAPSGSSSTTPGVRTPTLGWTSPPAKGFKASTGVLVGGKRWGTECIRGHRVCYYRMFAEFQFEIKCDMNAPCWCCQRRSEKTHPSENPSHSGTDGVHHLAPYPPHHTAPCRAPNPVHFGARA